MLHSKIAIKTLPKRNGENCTRYKQNRSFLLSIFDPLDGLDVANQSITLLGPQAPDLHRRLPVPLAHDSKHISPRSPYIRLLIKTSSAKGNLPNVLTRLAQLSDITATLN